MPVTTCQSCGQLVVNPSQPCSSCGDEISTTHPAQNVKTYTNNSHKNSSAPSASSNRPLIVDLCYVIGILLFILALVGSFMMFREYGFVIAVTSFLFSLITILLIYGIGEIINQLVTANNNAYVLRQQNERIISSVNAINRDSREV